MTGQTNFCLACGHPEDAHDESGGYCEECLCNWYVSEETFEPSGEGIEEWHLGEDRA